MGETNNEIYRQLIVERYTSPRHFRERLNNFDQTKIHHLNSPTCSDRLTMVVTIKKNTLQTLIFSGNACAIATASADLLIDRLQGLDLQNARQVLETYEMMISTGLVKDDFDLGTLLAFKNVYHQKNRQICAQLFSHGLLTVLEQESQKKDGNEN